MLVVEKNKVVSIDYTLKSDDGDVIDSSEGREPLNYIQGMANIIPGLEEAMEGKKVGDIFDVKVQPDMGYGPYIDSMRFVLPRENFRGVDKIDLGMRFHAQTMEGTQILTVVDVNGEDITVDGNHPLAGVTLNFHVEVKDIREATQEEIDHGHVHTENGHEH
jgi:FKBP-type peptidyl-prolyl cis-trans isomerase SlyD